MSITRRAMVDFGSGKAGLSTVGFTVFNSAASILQARTTTGVTNIAIGGTNTGIYTAQYTTGDNDSGFVVWDTGEASPRFAPEYYSSDIQSIQQDLADWGDISIIKNSLRNSSILYAKLLKELEKLENKKADKPKDYEKALNKIIDMLDKLDEKEYPKIKEIRQAVADVRIPAPVVKPIVRVPDVKIPKVEIPDYTKEIVSINKSIKDLRELIDVLPKDNTDTAEKLSQASHDILTRINTMSGDFIDEIQGKIENLSMQLTNSFSSQWMRSAKKEDIQSILSQIENFTLSLDTAKRELLNLLGQVNSGITGKVEEGYNTAVSRKRKELSDKRIMDRLRSIRIGAGINGKANIPSISQ